MAGGRFGRRSGLKALAGLLVACGVPFFGASGALGATYTPNRLNEDVPNGCTPADCSLREAINKANHHPGPDKIVLRGGKTYSLSLLNLPDPEDLNATGDLDVLDPLTITSSNRKLATVDAHQIDRVFETDPNNPVNLTLKRVEVRGGSTPAGTFESGGGLESAGGGTIRVLHSRIARNTATDGGGGGIDAGGGELDVVRSSIAQNRALDGEDGGGILANSSPETMTISRSRIVGNEATDRAGGIFTSDRLTVTRSTIANNRVDSEFADQGGGIVNDLGTTKVVGSTLSGNHSEGEGGGIANNTGGSIEIVGSTFTGNTSLTDGAAVENGDQATLINDTLAGNRATGDGGGIKSFPSTITSLNAVTVAGNEAITGDGGGIDASGGVINVENSLIALNLIGTGIGPDCHEASPGSIVSTGHDLIGDTTDCAGIFGGATHDILNVDPKIAQLAGNGGPTKTIALKANSKAINHAGNDAPKRDQRGVKRDAKPDIGAYERR